MDPDGKWTSTRAVLLAAAGQNRWPPAGSYMAATGQDLMAADRRLYARGLTPSAAPSETILPAQPRGERSADAHPLLGAMGSGLLAVRGVAGSGTAGLLVSGLVWPV